MKNLKKISELIKGELKGDGSIEIKSVNSPSRATPDEIAVTVKDSIDTEKLRAGALVVRKGSSISYPNIIFVDDPYVTLAELIDLFYPEIPFTDGIDDMVYISGSADIGKNVSIGSFSYISDNVKISDNCRIDSGVKIYRNVTIGKNCRIYSNVVIREDVSIGENVIIQPGAVIGSDGFGFARDSEGKPVKIPQKGIVSVGDNVEIGANVCIDRSTLEETVINDNVKIDNLVQIGHNVKVGKSTSISAQSGVSGSTEVGEKVIMAGQVGLSDHIKIGDNVIIAAKSGVSGNVSQGKIVAGIPHQDLMSWKKSSVIFKNIDKYLERIKILEKKVRDLEEK